MLGKIISSLFFTLRDHSATYIADVPLAVIITFFIILGTVTAFFLIYVPLFFNEAQRYLSDVPSFEFLIEPLESFLSGIDAPVASVDNLQSIFSDVTALLSDTISFGISQIQQTAGFVIGIILVPIFVFFWLWDTETLSSGFLKFLPKKKKELYSRLQELIKKTEAVVFFESPRRIRQTLALLSTLTGRKIFLIKEMTKTFEHSWRGSASELLLKLDQDPRGEFVGVLEKVDLSENIALDAEAFLKEMLKHLPPAKASRIAAKLLSGSRKEYYEMALSLM